MLHRKNNQDEVDDSQFSEDLLEHVQQQVSGVASKEIPKWRRLRPENLEAGIQKFLRENPDPFGVNK